MSSSYFRVAWRNLRKNKIYSFINIAGLSVGLTIFWLMALYIANELSYDRSSPNADRIYRVVHTADWPGGSFRLAPTAPPFAEALKKDYPEIEAAARIDREGGGILVYGDKTIPADDAIFADNALLTIFQWPFLYGDPSTALAHPHSLVLTSSKAKALFGDAANALNKTISFKGDEPSLVTGVMEDPPTSSHLTFSALRSFPQADSARWQDFSIYTYVLLRKNADANQLQGRLSDFYDHHLKAVMGPGIHYHMELQPLPSIHLHSHLDYEISENGNMQRIWIFSAVALLVLIIAVINYINLATARSSVRIREIGVRKVIGANHRQLISHFLAESILIAVISAVLALSLMSILMPLFNRLASRDLSIGQFGLLPTALVLGAFTLLTGIAGGLYPAFFLARFQMIPALKGQQGDLSTTILFRKFLVTFQFLVTIFLIAGSSALYLQVHFMQNKDLGFNKDQVVTVHLPNPAVRQHIEDLKTQLLQDPSVEAASGASIVIGNNNIGSGGFRFEENGQISPESRIAQDYFVDADYIPTMQIQVAKGRNFSSALPTDKFSSVIVNETLVKMVGWKDPIGKRVQVKGENGTVSEAKVIGVVKDFNIYSLQHRIEPLLLAMPPVLNEEDNLYIRVAKNKVSQALKHIEEVCKTADPATTFSYRFLDENFAQQYEEEKRQGKLLLIFTGLAIFIACMGLFGLVTFSVGQRTKELGIRKVLGASVPGIMLLVSKDLIRPILIAILISLPISWYAIHRWLSEFAYHIDLSWWILLGAGTLAVLIALFTVGWKAMLAARANPADSLRTE